ncbi:hypothetical protein RRG08_057038 [Elysia crispata]|uniref:Uncharacterized protein n=1 Tax=Elysia crispata TaxID=231223 RepID=A0AAE0Z6M2_9GAST|nr:hypothetical protein RRG08_057037 [Elysia crispata]KAK3763616.1 hypothetical protein RRG08_057038 [Elysia crispata]
MGRCSPHLNMQHEAVSSSPKMQRGAVLSSHKHKACHPHPNRQHGAVSSSPKRVTWGGVILNQIGSMGRCHFQPNRQHGVNLCLTCSMRRCHSHLNMQHGAVSSSPKHAT